MQKGYGVPTVRIALVRESRTKKASRKTRKPNPSGDHHTALYSR